MHHDSSSARPSSPPVPQPSRPSVLGIWRLGEVLHTSDVAELCLTQPADAVGSPRWDYVLKRSLPTANGVDASDEARQQIDRFVSAASAATHPNLVAVLDASSVGSVAYAVMPRLDGENMSELLVDDAAVALPVALWWTRQAAQGLAALHAAGWVHQDIKPENIIVAPRGHVTVVDLGFAARIGEITDKTFRGTAGYAAPEQLATTEPAQAASDIYSLGRVLWSWMTSVVAANDGLLSPVAELVEKMVSDEPKYRPTANGVSQQLLRLEIESLGRHIGPTKRRAA